MRKQLTDWGKPNEWLINTQWGSMNYLRWCTEMSNRMKRATEVVTGKSGMIALFAL